MMRAASVVVAITNSSKRQFVATDDALQAAHIGAEEDKEALQGRSPMCSSNACYSAYQSPGSGLLTILPLAQGWVKF
jgi:hypothetical protein